MLNPSADRDVNNIYQLSTEKARQWWNNQAFESRKNIVIESDAVINDDKLVEDQTIADIADKDYDDLPDTTKQEVELQVESEDIEQVFDVEDEEYLQCSICDDVFTTNDDYELHKSVDHGEEPEDFEESEETYQLTMHPELTRESLRKANNLLTETEERQLYSGYDKNGDVQSSIMPYNVPSVATGKYNDNPNSFFYSNKIFRAGSSTERISSLGEAKASETQDDFDWLNEDKRFTATMWEQSDGTWIVNSEGDQFESFTARFTDSVDAHKYMDKVNRGELTKDDLYNDEMSGYRILESKASEDYYNKTAEDYADMVEGEEPEPDEDLMKGVDVESKASELGIGSTFNMSGSASDVGEQEFWCRHIGTGGIKCGEPFPEHFNGNIEDHDFYPIAQSTQDQMDGKLNESKATEKGEWDWLDKGADNKSVDYDKVEYKDDGVSDISIQNAEPKLKDQNSFLDNVNIGVESVDYVYKTKAHEAMEKTYIPVSETFEEDYEEFEDSDEAMIKETITLRKLTGYGDDAIARELNINYGVSHEEALEKVYSVEVSTNDKVSQTFFGKMYKECTESEKDELRMYSGSD